MNKKIDESNIIFLTTTIGTRWVFYQQYLLDKFFPLSKKVLINGNQRWDFTKGLNCVWYDFIRIALKYKFDYTYFVHIDEDCFILDPRGVLEVLTKMENENADLIGPSDYFEGVRWGNSDIINSFFMAGKLCSLDIIFKNFDFDLTFHKIKPSLETNVTADLVEIEPYYNFFWNYLNNGMKIAHIKHEFNKDYLCTNLLNEENLIFALHMWFTRKWYSKDIFHGMTMYNRYKRVQNYLNFEFNITFFHVLKSNKQLKQMLKIQYSRTIQKNVLRIERKLLKLLEIGIQQNK